MPVLFLNWGDLGPYGGLVDGTPTVDTGGVNVGIEVDGVTEGDIGVTVNTEAFVGAGEPFNPNSHLKLFGDGVVPEGTPPGVTDVSTTTLTFSSADPLYGDEVQNISFRINDIDGAAVSDDDGIPAPVFEDIVSVRAFDAAGNPVPVTLTPGGGVTVAGETATGDGNFVQTDEPASMLVEIAGPVARVEIDYDNGEGGTQNVVVSDVFFETIDADPNDPDAEDDTISTTVGSPIEVPVLANDSDPNGDALTITETTPPTNGTVTVNGDGTITYTPTPGFTGDDSFTYTVTDGNGGFDTATVTVSVDPDDTNQAPDAVDDTATVPPGATTAIPVLGNDTDPDGDALTVTGVTDPANGTATVNPDGTINYTPNADFTGEDTVTYTISDGNGGTDTAELIITVDDGINEAPDAVDDSVSTPIDAPVTITPLGNDTDPDGDTLTVISFDAPTNGTAVLNADGTFTYTPNPGFEGTETFEYIISDGNGGVDAANITVTVGDVNAAPDAVDDATTTALDTPATFAVLGNDTDPDGDALTVTGITDPTNGTAVVNADGTITYTPNAGFTGEDTVTYTISDGNGGTDTAELVVTVEDDPNTAPDAVDDATTTPVDTPATFAVLGNDTDPDGDTLSVTDVTDGANGTAVVNADGTVTYTPNAGFIGEDTVTYTISDGNGGTDTAEYVITIDDGVNDAPDAVDDSVATPLDTPVTITPLANDTDPDGDTLQVVSFDAPTNGTAVLNADGTFTFTPNPGFTGSETFEYIVSDGNGGFDAANITVTVGDANTAPDAVDDATSTPVDTPATFAVLGNDTDPDGDTLSVTDVTDGANGTAVVNADGTVTYTPNAGFTGEDTVTYTISDGNGGTDTAELVVTITDEPNTAPDAVDDATTTAVDTPATFAVLGNDTDPDGDTLSVTDVTDGANGTAVVNADGTVTYTPNAGFTGEDTVTYTISDGNGGTDTAELVVTITPEPNTAPDAVDDVTSTPVDTAATFAVLGNDTDPDGDPLSVTDVTDGANGTAVVNADGTVTYTPNAGFTGEDTVTYTISDGNGGTDTAELVITVSDDNVAPVANDDFAQALPEEEISIPVLGNDADPDGDPISVVPGSLTAPANGVAFLAGDGTITYIPDPDFTGVDTFDYTITDPDGLTSTATVTVSVGEGRIDTDVFPVDPALQGIDPLNGFDEDDDPSDDLDSVVGTGGADFIQTGDDADTIIGNGGDDTILGGIDDDSIQGNAGNDSIVDVQGADTIGGGSGNDTIDAGANTFSDYVGDDAFFAPGGLGNTLGFDSDPNQEDGRDLVDGGAGEDFILTGDDRDTITAGADNDTVDGGIDDDLIFGEGGADELIGNHGSDTIDGGAGNDLIDAGHSGTFVALEAIDDNGADSDLVPGNDRDSVLGGNGNDTIFTGDDADTIEGQGGNDSIFSGIDDDSVLGQGGRDTINTSQGSDFVDGGDEDDVINTSNLGERTLIDADGADPFEGDDRDTVLGGQGDDTIVTGDDDDSVDGGIGDDVIDTGIDDDTVDGGAGNDEIITSQGSDSVLGGDGDDTIDAANFETRDAVDEIDTLPGDDLDFVDAGEGDNTVFTGDDDDTIISGSGADFIDAGIDDDSVVSGAGNDTIFGQHGSDTIDAGDGNDSIEAGNTEFGGEETDDTDPNPDNDRDSILAGAGDDTISTGDDADTIDGGDGNDSIIAGIDDDLVDGGAGDDEIFGGQGDDTIIGDDGADTVDAGTGDDDINTAGDPATELTDDVDPDTEDDRDEVFAGEGNDTIVTGDDDDTIDGGDGDDVIDAGIDDDSVTGGFGDDTIDGGQGDDTIFGQAGADVVDGGDGNDAIDTSGDLATALTDDVDPDTDDDRDSVLGGDGDDTIVTGDDADTIDGGDGDDVIDGGIDDDLIDGGDGSDEILGGQGDDTITGDDGADTVNAGEGDDVVDTSGDPATELTDDVDPDPLDDRDEVFGEGGDDTITTGDDADFVDGGDGDDVIDAGIDNDTVFGGFGDDSITAGQGDDSVEAGDGADTVDGGEGDDLLDARGPLGTELTDDIDTDPDNDRDSVLGGDGADTILTGDDADTIDGGDGDDVIDAGIDNDSVTGGEGDDDITAGGGDDTVFGGDGADTVDGGDGDDAIITSGDPATELTDDVDPDTEDDRDSVIGGDGNDTIVTGDDADTIEGGFGDDVIDAGIDNDSVDGGAGDDEITAGQGDDTVTGGDGADTVDGGTGDDVIDTSGDPLTELTDDIDPDPEDDRDSVLGGEGDDTITTGDDADTIDGGDGADVIDAGIDDDLVFGGDGDDSITAGEGDDEVEGGDGNDTILGGDGADTVDGGDGDDVIDTCGDPATELTDDIDPDTEDDRDLVLGGAGDDTITTCDDADTIDGGEGNDVIDAGIDNDIVDGGTGDDEILGGQGEDTLTGGDGNDTITGGEGPDVIDGGADRDVIVIDSAENGIGDTIGGGSAGDDFDVLDLTGAGIRGQDWRLVNQVTDSDGNGIDGTIEFFDPTAGPDGTGAFVQGFDFTNIEAIPCFTPGTTIATPTGERLVEDLREGDRVITRDNGLQEIRWIGQKELTGHQLARVPHLKPILIQAGSLGPNLPEHDMLVSPNHRVLVSNDKTSLYFEEREVLASAKHLTGLEGVDEVGTLGVTYVHFMFDQHEVVLSNGAWTESFQPGDYTMSGMGNAQRNEIFELFPELKTREGLESYTAARRSLKRHEAELLSR